MSSPHDDATVDTGDPFDGVDTASEITEQTGMVSEFTMEKEERSNKDNVATGIEEIKEEAAGSEAAAIGGEAASVSPSVGTQQEKIKARAQLLGNQAKAVSSRAIESVKSYEQEHHIVEKAKEKAQTLASLVAGKVKACTSPGAKATGGDDDDQQVATAVHEHKDGGGMDA